MTFGVGDRVEWSDGHPDQGSVVAVQSKGTKCVRVLWDSGAIGWVARGDIRFLDVVTRLGDVIR